MESRKAKIIAALLVISFIVLLIIFRFFLKHSSAFFFILGADIAGILAVITWVVIQHRADRKRQLLERQLVSEGRELRIEYSFLRKVAGLPTKFRYKELEAATDNFQALLGRGASARVFKGILEDGTAVAVKWIGGAEHGEKEFRAEVAAISSVQHVNLVRLLGYSSVSGGARLLVYEFVHNGSLDNWIFPQRTSNNRKEPFPSCSCLPWKFRHSVAIDVAKALSYLHHDCRARILHLDVKPENILLDESFRAVVSDFGLSKLMGRDVSRVYSTVRGTRGYLAPEWLLQNGISEKSDIYSYGMVLLEIVGGQRNVQLVEEGGNSQRKWSYFPKIVTQKLKEGKVMEVVDERLFEGGGIVDEGEVRLMVQVALWCIQEDPRLRPSMAQVVDMLEGRALVENPPETEMIIVDLLSIDNESLNVPRDKRIMQPTHSSSTYSHSMSVLSGR